VAPEIHHCAKRRPDLLDERVMRKSDKVDLDWTYHEETAQHYEACDEMDSSALQAQMTTKNTWMSIDKKTSDVNL